MFLGSSWAEKPALLMLGPPNASSSESSVSICSHRMCWMSDKLGLSAVMRWPLVLMTWSLSLLSIMSNHFSTIKFSARGLRGSFLTKGLPLYFAPSSSRESE